MPSIVKVLKDEEPKEEKKEGGKGQGTRDKEKRKRI
jgi:hypothetical protein